MSGFINNNSLQVCWILNQINIYLSVCLSVCLAKESDLGSNYSYIYFSNFLGKMYFSEYFDYFVLLLE